MNPELISKPLFKHIVVALILAMTMLVVFIAIPERIPASPNWTVDFGTDWNTAYRPALDNLLSGKSPYKNDASSPYPFFNPPWALLPMIPLAPLSDRLASSILAVINLFCFGFVGYKLSGTWQSALLMTLSPAALLTSIAGNIDGITALGLILPPQIGMFFIMLKPQGLGFVALIWFIQAFRIGGIKEIFRVFYPFGIVMIISLLIMPEWPSAMFSVVNYSHNISPFPILIPVGALLLARALQENKIDKAVLASPFFAPYLQMPLSFGLPLFGLARNWKDLAIVVLSLWMVYIAIW